MNNTNVVRFSVIIRKDQSDWINQQAGQGKTKSEVLREIIDKAKLGKTKLDHSR